LSYTVRVAVDTFLNHCFSPFGNGSSQKRITVITKLISVVVVNEYQLTNTKPMKKILLFFSILLFSASDMEAKNPAPSLVADFTASATVICAGQSVSFTDLTTENPDGWTWTFNGGSPSTSTLQNPTVVYNVPGVYTVHLKSNNSLEGDEEIKVDFIKVLANPISTFTSSPNQCLTGNSFNFTNTGSTGVHAWTFAGGTPASSNLTSPTGITFAASGPHTISHTVTDDGCSSTTTATVTVFSSPIGVGVSTTPSNCASATGTITIGAVNGGTAPFTYSVDGSSFTTTTFYSSKTPGFHTVTVKDANGCTFSASPTVGSLGGPTALVATPTSTTCNSANGIITLGAVTGGVSPYTFAVDNNTFTTTTVYNNIIAGLHVVKVKDVNGCTFSKNVTVVNSNPSAVVINTTASACSPATGTITLGAVTGGRPPYTFSIDGGSFSSATNYTGLTAGTHTIVVRDVTNCSFTTTRTITTTPGPTGHSVAATFSACSTPTGSVLISNVIGGTSPYTFSFNGSGFTSTNQYTNLAAGTYTFVIKDANGCTRNGAATVANTLAPTAIAVTVSPSACLVNNGSILLGTVTGGLAPYTFSLNGSSFTTTTNYTGLAAGTYTLVVKDANGCTFTRTVTVANTAPTDIVLTPSSTTCTGSTGSILIGAVTGGVSPFVFSLNTSAFTNTSSYTGLAVGSYTVTVKDFNGCTFAETVTVNNTQPTALATTITNTPCGASAGSIVIGTVTGGIAPFTFSVNNSAFNTTTTYSNLAAGTYTIVVKDANTCTFTKTVVVASASGPTGLVVSVTGATCGASNGSVTMGVVTGGVAPFTFALDNGLFTSATVYTNLASGTHGAKVKDANGCIFTELAIVINTSGPAGFIANASSATCGNANGTITIGTVTGGTLPYTYSVDGSAFTTATNYTGLTSGSKQIIVKDANGCTISSSLTVGNSAGPSAANLGIRKAGCVSTTDGQVVINSVVGGLAPFTYSFNGSAFTGNLSYSGLTAGSYPIIVKDANGCTFATTAIVPGVPLGPTAITTSKIPPGCGVSNGSITVTGVTNGTAPYLYSLNSGTLTSSNVFAGLPAGAHTITVSDANNCAISFSNGGQLVSTGGPSNVATTFVNSTCGQPNGSITIVGTTGGVPPYQYSFNGAGFASNTVFANLTGLTIFPLVIKDATGCTYNTSAGLSNTGTPPATPTISQNGFLLTSSASSGNQWFFNGTPIAGQTGQTHFAQFNGSYTVVTTSGGCSSAPSAPVVITNQSSRFANNIFNNPEITFTSDSTGEIRGNGMNQALLISQTDVNPVSMLVYPNPNDGNFIISFEASVAADYTIEVFNLFGQPVYADKLTGFTGTYNKEMNLSQYGSGIYTIVLTRPGGKTVQKMVVY
jgi:large repetitive protein